MIYLLFLPSCLLVFFTEVLTKRFQIVKPNGALGYMLYAFITGLFTATFMFFTNGMVYRFDIGLILLSAIYAAVCIFGYYVTMNSLKHLGVLLSSVLSCWSLLPVVILERLFGIRHHGLVLLGVCGSIAASMLAAFAAGTKKEPVTKKGLLFGLLKGFIAAANTLLLRLMLLFYGADRLLDYYGFTNIFICLFAVLILAVMLFVKRERTRQTVRQFRLSHVLIILLLCLINAVGSKLSSYLLGAVAYLPYAVLNGFFGSLACMSASLFYREPLTVKRLIALVLQGASGVIAGIGQQKTP